MIVPLSTKGKTHKTKYHLYHEHLLSIKLPIFFLSKTDGSQSSSVTLLLNLYTHQPIINIGYGNHLHKNDTPFSNIHHYFITTPKLPL